MRDIIFRGKRLDNGEWVEGYYTELPIGSSGATIFANDDEVVCEDTASYIIKVFTKQHSNYSNGNPLCVVECETYEVDPSTIGQYTGKTDKNGKKIFEGDIFCELDGGMDGIPRMVIWDEEHMEFKCPLVKKHWAFGNNNCSLWLMKYGDIEVIGNIHDNPELLR